MGATASATRNCVGWLIFVEAFVDMAKASVGHIQFEVLWQVCIPSIFTGLNMFKTIDDLLRLAGEILEGMGVGDI